MKNSWLNEVRRLTGAQEGDCALLLFAAPRWSPQWDHPRSAGAQFSCLLSHDEPA